MRASPEHRPQLRGGKTEGDTGVQTETGEPDGCGRTGGQTAAWEGPGGGLGVCCGSEAARGSLIGWRAGWAGPLGDGRPRRERAGAPALSTAGSLSPRREPGAPAPLPLSAQVCCGVSPALRPGLPRSTLVAPTRGSLGEGSRHPDLCPGLLPLLSVRFGLLSLGRGQVLACVSPLLPRPGAQIPASGGGRETPGPSTRPGARLLRRAGRPEPERERETRPGPATCPGRSALGLRTPTPAPPPSDPPVGPEPPFCPLPPSGVCCLVLVALSLWPGRAAAPGPPPGPSRASPDPRAELDSAVLLTRSLLADTRQLAAQLVGEPGGDGLGPRPRTGRASGLPRWQRRGRKESGARGGG